MFVGRFEFRGGNRESIVRLASTHSARLFSMSAFGGRGRLDKMVFGNFRTVLYVQMSDMVVSWIV